MVRRGCRKGIVQVQRMAETNLAAESPVLPDGSPNGIPLGILKALMATGMQIDDAIRFMAESNVEMAQAAFYEWMDEVADKPTEGSMTLDQVDNISTCLGIDILWAQSTYVNFANH